MFLVKFNFVSARNGVLDVRKILFEGIFYSLPSSFSLGTHRVFERYYEVRHSSSQKIAFFEGNA